MSDLRAKLNEIIFGYETRAGRLFDVVLIVVILLSVLAVMLDSVAEFRQQYGTALRVVEWSFTILFTIEYLLRLYSTDSIRKYAFSFFGIVDLVSTLPTYLGLLLPEAQVTYLIIFRILRTLRIFRVLKLVRYIGEANIMMRALRQSRRKILVFVFSVLSLNIVFGSVIFLVEGPENGFTSIPVSIYWAIVTMTTVGFGDITPVTALGRMIASVAMITGYAIIAIPTGIVSSELMNEFYNQRRQDIHDFSIACPSCKRKGHDRDANHCKQCGEQLAS